jgi:hypothetical protein
MLLPKSCAIGDHECQQKKSNASSAIRETSEESVPLIAVEQFEEPDRFRPDSTNFSNHESTRINTNDFRQNSQDRTKCGF